MSLALHWRPPVAEDRSLALLGALAAAGAAVLAPWAPVLARLAPACPFHAWTGLPCPGCGSTRATLALLEGDVATALAFNPLATIGLVVGFIAATLALPWVLARGPLPVLAGEVLPGRMRVAAWTALGAQWVWLVVRGV